MLERTCRSEDNHKLSLTLDVDEVALLAQAIMETISLQYLTSGLNTLGPNG